MAEVVIERALFVRDREALPRLLRRSQGFAEHLLEPLTDLLVAFGERPAGVACSGALFAQPLGDKHVAVVQISDGSLGPTGWASLRFSVLVATRRAYDILGADPIVLAQRVPPVDDSDSVPVLDAVRLPAQEIFKRDISQVRTVLQRIKAYALPENVDPEALPSLTLDNAESPTLLGAAQILVDGGKLVFERSQPDASVVAALWTLLPHTLRGNIWPATFAFANDLGFDVVVVPRFDVMPLEGYTKEADAGDYPAGSYELALQTAAESGDERDLDAVFARRTSNETLWLGVKLLIGLSLVVLASRWIAPTPAIDPAPRAAAAASIVGVRDPWMALPMLDFGNRIYLKN